MFTRVFLFRWFNNKKKLVGGAITVLKNMKFNGKDDIPYMKWKLKVMSETTNV